MLYKTILVSDILELDGEVNSFIQQGWEPLGGPAILPKGDFHRSFLQAMVKKDG